MGIFVWCWCFYSTQLILFFKFKDLFKRVIYRNMQSVTVIFVFKEFIEDVGIRRFMLLQFGVQRFCRTFHHFAFFTTDDINGF